MKIVIPTDGEKGLDERVADHFGRCATYTFLDEEGKLLEVADNRSRHAGGRGLPPELMKEKGADILLCRALGPRAIELCGRLGIDVYVSDAETVKEIFEEWKQEKISKAGVDDACDHPSH